MFNNETLYEDEQGGFKRVKKATIQSNCKVPAYYSLQYTVPFSQSPFLSSCVYACLINKGII